MGCVVNGPGEAEGADVAVFAGDRRGIIYVQGERVANVKEEEILDALLEECRRFQDAVRNGDAELGQKKVDIVPRSDRGTGLGSCQDRRGQRGANHDRRFVKPCILQRARRVHCIACPPAAAFTLIELLVVIAILAILMGIILVSVRSVYRTALKTDELSRIKQLGNAWLMYSQSHRDSMVAGWMDHTAQVRRDLHQVYPDLTEIPPAPDWDPSRENVAGYWTWQLLPYLDHSWPVIRGHLPERADGRGFPERRPRCRLRRLRLQRLVPRWPVGRWDPHYPNASFDSPTSSWPTARRRISSSPASQA